MKIFTMIVLNILLFSRISFPQWEEITFPEGYNPKDILSLNGYLFIACSNNDSGVVFRSSDIGMNWISCNNNLLPDYKAKLFRINTSTNDYIFINTNLGLYATSDNGNTWFERNSGIGSQKVFSLYYKDGIMLAGSYQHNFRSTDLGENWTEISIGTNQQTAGAFLKYTDYFIAGMRDGLSDFLYKSTDNGQSWLRFGNDDYGFDNIVAIGNSIYASGGTGLLKSTDGCENMDVVSGLPLGYYYHRLKTVDSYLLVFHDTGVYLKHNDSTSWYKASDSIFVFIYEGESDNEFLYAISEFPENKIWKRNIPGFITAAEDLNNTSYNFNLEQNYPNPFNPTTNIQFQIPEMGFISLKIYDILGNEITTLVNEEFPSGKYEVKFNAPSISSGVYFYKLQAGSFVETKKMILMR